MKLKFSDQEIHWFSVEYGSPLMPIVLCVSYNVLSPLCFLEFLLKYWMLWLSRPVVISFLIFTGEHWCFYTYTFRVSDFVLWSFLLFLTLVIEFNSPMLLLSYVNNCFKYLWRSGKINRLNNLKIQLLHVRKCDWSNLLDALKINTGVNIAIWANYHDQPPASLHFFCGYYIYT